jgi:hypothetical protein
MARNADRTERRQARISEALQSRITKQADPVMAEIAVLTYDMDTVAERLAAGADYDTLTSIIAAELTAERIAPRSESTRKADAARRISEAKRTASAAPRHRAEPTQAAPELPESRVTSDSDSHPESDQDESEAIRLPARSVSPVSGAASDDAVMDAIRDHVIESRRLGREPVQREMQRIVYAATGFRIGQKRCTRIADMIKIPTESTESATDHAVNE